MKSEMVSNSAKLDVMKRGVASKLSEVGRIVMKRGMAFYFRNQNLNDLHDKFVSAASTHNDTEQRISNCV